MRSARSTRKVGVTAGFEPAGGGFSQYVRVMDWIVERGVEKIPDGVSFERASFRRAGEHVFESRGAVRAATG
jgi:threonine dehydrogenase-like Zn-dependent dehydrogenase